jgi:hypothetical protein
MTVNPAKTSPSVDDVSQRVLNSDVAESFWATTKVGFYETLPTTSVAAR